MGEARRPLVFGVEFRKRLVRRQASLLEIGTYVGVAVTALGQALRAKRRRARVVDVAEALKVVERAAAFRLADSLALEPPVELRPGAVGGAERTEGDVLRL